MSNSNLDNALLDVRKAYRLLQRYQRRVLDLSAALAREIDEYAAFRYWCPVYYQPNPGSYTNPAGRWAWDGLPYFDFCAFYVREEFWKDEHAPGDWMLVIRCTADTGYSEVGDEEPDPLGFRSVADSSSLLRLYCYQYTQAKVEPWVNGAFWGSEWPDEGEGSVLGGNLLGRCIRVPLAEVSSMKQMSDLATRGRAALMEMQSSVVAPGYMEGSGNE